MLHFIALQCGIGRSGPARKPWPLILLATILLATILLVPCLAAPGAAAAPPLPGIIGDDDRQALPLDRGSWPWSSIGRVNRSTGGFCTGTLIAADQVLTSAHCLWNSRTGRMLRPEALHFVAGWERGDYLAHGRVAAIRTAAGLTVDLAGRPDELRHDWAVLMLTAPLSGATAVQPVAPTASRPDVGDRLSRAGYGRDRPHGLSRHDGCRVVALADGLVLHDCDATHGESGSPLLSLDEGTARLVAIHAGYGHYRGQAVGIAVEISAAILAPP